MTSDDKIVTHSDPVERTRTNYIIRLAVNDPPDDHFEQVWTRTDDRITFELCCIPFFPYGVSLGDLVRVATDGTFEVVQKSGHQTIRVIILDAEFAHVKHTEFHDLVARTGVRCETFGHASSYWAFDIADGQQADALIAAITPFSEERILDWEWADKLED